MNTRPLIVVALGGNAILRRGEATDDAIQRNNVKTAAKAIARLAERNRLVVTHGNGPQVGLLALQAEAYDPDHPARLDLLDAETEGAIGYLLEQELSNELPGREVAALLTRTLVDPRDPAFAAPTKPIGPTYRQETAQLLAAERGGSSLATEMTIAEWSHRPNRKRSRSCRASSGSSLTTSS